MNMVIRLLLADPRVGSTADLTTVTVCRFAAAAARGRSPNTVIGLLTYLRAAVNLAVAEGWLDRPPRWERAWPRREPTRRKTDLTVDQVARLLGHLAERADGWHGRRIYTLTCLVALTGLRRTEAHCLLAEDLDVTTGRLWVRPAPGRPLKTAGSAASVPIPAQACAALRGWLPRVSGCPWVFPGATRRGPWTGGPLGRRSRDELQRAAAAVDLPRIDWHSLRHTFASHAVGDWGLPIWVVSRILRHSSPRTTEIYLHLDDLARISPLVESCRYPHQVPVD